MGSAASRLNQPAAEPFDFWYAALQERYLADLSFREARRAIQALSTLYVENRRRLEDRSPLDTAGKRAAFAAFYAPLHFLLVRLLVRALKAEQPAPSRIFDLGCGTGAAGAAWAMEASDPPVILGVDQNPWAAREAGWTYRMLGVRGNARRADFQHVRFAGRQTAILAAFAVNELGSQLRSRLLIRLRNAATRGAAILIVEPISRRAAPWWGEWEAAFRAMGGRSDQWRFSGELPETLQAMDQAAGLDHRLLTCRSLWRPLPDGRGSARLLPETVPRRTGTASRTFRIRHSSFDIP